MADIGMRIKQKRESARLSMTELAVKAGMSPQGLWNLENNVVGKTFEKLPALAKALGCSIDDLFPEMDNELDELEM